METRANYALIGAFVLLAAAAIVGFILWLGQAQFSQAMDSYDIVFDGPVSLEESASVRYIGIKVGEVQSVRIDRADPSKVRARIRIDSETPVKTDSTAAIQLAGITGVTFVQINAGSTQAAFLTARPGEPVPVIQAEPNQLGELIANGGEIMGKANLAIERVNQVLTAENIDSINTTLANIETITQALAAGDGLIGQASSTLTDVSEASLRFEAASRSLDSFGQTADKRIADFGDEMQLLVNDLRLVTQSTDATIQESTRAIAAAADAIEGPATTALEDAGIVSQDLRVLINRLDRIARDVERNPQTLVVGEPVPYEKERR